LCFSIAFFRVASSNGARRGSQSRMSNFKVCRGADPQFRYSSWEMFAQIFQDARLLAHGSRSCRSGMGFDGTSLRVDLGRRTGGIDPP
jgi:hypothetical protein